MTNFDTEQVFVYNQRVTIFTLSALIVVVVLAVLLAVQLWRRRHRAVPKSFAVRVVGHSSAHTDRTRLGDSLTPRETQVAHLVAQGKRNADIAHELCISVFTVDTHLKHIYTKLNVHTRVELARVIRDWGD